ncbi:MAG: NAD(P)-dependent oxidoreductase [Verrucomicrobiota bacterium]
MIIYFVETESEDREFFFDALPCHELHFVDSLSEVGEDAEIVSVFFNSRIGVHFLSAHPNLRLIASRTTAFDHLDTAACHEYGVKIAVVPSFADPIVAEHAFALILALSRRLREAMVVGKGPQSTHRSVRGMQLKGKTFGVVGAGRVGIHVLRLAKAFGMNAVAYDLRPLPILASALEFEYLPLEELLARSDVVSLHIPLTLSTRHLFNRDTFAMCKPGMILVNTARGALIDTDAMLEALDSGILRGVGLDVLEEERVLQQETMDIIGEQIVSRLQSGAAPDEVRGATPGRVDELQRLMRNTALISRLNVVFTPHVAFNSVEAVASMHAATADNIRAFAAGEPVNLVETGEVP